MSPEIQEVTYPPVSQRALAGTQNDELWLIPVELKNRTEFQIAPTSKFVRTPGGSYTFVFGLWERKDGDPCEEQPGMIYAMGHLAQTLVAN